MVIMSCTFDIFLIITFLHVPIISSRHSFNNLGHNFNCKCSAIDSPAILRTSTLLGSTSSTPFYRFLLTSCICEMQQFGIDPACHCLLNSALSAMLLCAFTNFISFSWSIAVQYLSEAALIDDTSTLSQKVLVGKEVPLYVRGFIIARFILPTHCVQHISFWSSSPRRLHQAAAPFIFLFCDFIKPAARALKGIVYPKPISLPP